MLLKNLLIFYINILKSNFVSRSGKNGIGLKNFKAYSTFTNSAGSNKPFDHNKGNNDDCSKKSVKPLTWEEKKMYLYSIFFFFLFIFILFIYIIYKIWKWWTYVEPPFPPPLNCYRFTPLTLDEMIAQIKKYGLDVLPPKLTAMFNPTAWVQRNNVFFTIPNCMRTFYLDYYDYFALHRRVTCSVGVGKSFETGLPEAFIKTSISIYTKCGHDGTRLSLVLFKSINWDLYTLNVAEYCSSSLTFSHISPSDGYTDVVRTGKLTWSEVFDTQRMLYDKIRALDENPETIWNLNLIDRYREHFLYNGLMYSDLDKPFIPKHPYDGAAFG